MQKQPPSCKTRKAAVHVAHVGLLLLARLLPPAQHGVVVVRPRVDHLVGLVVVGQVRVAGVAAECCVQAHVPRQHHLRIKATTRKSCRYYAAAVADVGFARVTQVGCGC